MLQTPAQGEQLLLKNVVRGASPPRARPVAPDLESVINELLAYTWVPAAQRWKYLGVSHDSVEAQEAADRWCHSGIRNFGKYPAQKNVNVNQGEGPANASH